MKLAVIKPLHKTKQEENYTDSEDETAENVLKEITATEVLSTLDERSPFHKTNLTKDDYLYSQLKRIVSDCFYYI